MQDRRYKNQSFQPDCGFLFDGSQVGEKKRCVFRVKKSEDINVLPSSENLLDDIAARNQRMVVEGLQSSHFFLSMVSVDVQKLKTATLVIEVFLESIHLFSKEEARIARWLKRMSEFKKKTYTYLRADGLLGRFSFEGLWLDLRDKLVLVSPQPHLAG